MAHPHAAPRWHLASPRSLPSRPRLALILGAIVVVAGAAIGAFVLTRPAPAATFRLVPAARITLSQSLSATGTIAPATTSTLSFSAPGQVTAVRATVGEHVAAGQVLATMSSPTLQAQVAQANASLSQDQSALSQDEASGASSAQVTADEAAVSADQAQVTSADQALAGATLTAPAAGIVTAVGITVGPQAGSGGGGGGGGAGGGGGSGGGGSDGGGGSGGGSGSGSQSITVVSAGDVVSASVDASVVDQIKTGDQVVITTEGASGPVQGTVGSIGLVASTSSGVATFPVVIDVTGTPAGLYSGASANVSIVYHQVPDALVVPAAALTRADGKTVVYTMTGGRKVARTVTTGITTGGLTQITGGLQPGQQVVVSVVQLSGGGSGGPGGPKRFGGPGGGVFIGPRGGVIVGPGGGGPGVNFQQAPGGG